jgi:hypothetical protein
MFQNLELIIKTAQTRFCDMLDHVSETGGLTLERYSRFLTMQYHLTNGVQRHFLAIAANPELTNRRRFRDFLYNFALEEEPHYLIAAKDLENLGLKPGECPLDVKLWWAFFDTQVYTKPFIRLGATCILENISVGADGRISSLLASSSFLNPRNTRFLIIHRHVEIPHGDQILEALRQAHPNEAQIADLEEGARIGSAIYLRLFHWVINGETR